MTDTDTDAVEDTAAGTEANKFTMNVTALEGSLSREVRPNTCELCPCKVEAPGVRVEPGAGAKHEEDLLCLVEDDADDDVDDDFFFFNDDAAVIEEDEEDLEETGEDRMSLHEDGSRATGREDPYSCDCEMSFFLPLPPAVSESLVWEA